MRVLLVDDHALFREGVVLLLKSAFPDIHVDELGSADEVLARYREPPIEALDLLLLDLNLPGLHGIEAIRTLRQLLPSVPLVALSSDDDRETVLRALDAGAMGFVPKTSSSAILAASLKLILAKGVYLPPTVFLPDRQGQTPMSAHASEPLVEHRSRRPADLGITPRQADVLYLILQGKAAKLISRELGLSANTVKAHTSAVLRALNVTTRTQAVIAAGRLGLKFEESS